MEPSRESASAVLVGVVVGDDVEFKSGVVVLPALGGPDIGPAQHTTEHLAQRSESLSCPNARLYGSRSLGHIDETQTSKGVPPIPRRTRCFGMFRNGSKHAKSTATNTHDVLIAVLHLRKLEQMLI